jgi:xanthine dehydrogenase small subunit
MMHATKSKEPGTAGTIRFVLDGRTVAVPDPAPTTTLLAYLRQECGSTGTKEGCAEGDCGACTVVIGEPAGGGTERNGGRFITYRAINSCIRFLPTLDGKEIVTVEGLKGPDGKLHPVQQAMVDCDASQCGFCTPGFVMSLFALYLSDAQPARGAVVDALAGNLCRCTGYRPIIEAALRMHGYPEPPLWSQADSQSAARRESLGALQRTGSLSLPGFAAPRSLDEFAAAYEARPDSLILAGATDIGLWVTKQMRELPPLLYLGEVADLKFIREADGVLQIGAAVPLAEAWDAVVARWPTLAEMANRFASPPIRNSGTLCGNIANGSPIGDSMPALIALGASVELRRGARRRELPLEELYLGYQKKALEAGEFVASVSLPLPRPGQRIASYKISKRIDQDISAVCSAYLLEMKDGRILTARIAHGGMAATPKRATHAEAALVGKSWTLETFQAAAGALASDYSPIGDMRASAAYRLQVAQNLLQRFFHEHSGTQIPTRVEAVAAEQA